MEYKQDFMNLATQAPQEAAEVAMKWRERFVNQSEVMKKSTEDIMEIGVAGLSSFGIAFMDGGWEAKADQLVLDWEEGGAEAAGTNVEDHAHPWDHEEGDKNPMKTWGMGYLDNTLVVTMGLAALTAFNIAKKYTPVFRAAALGTGSYWAGSVGRSLGYKRAKTKLESGETADSKAA
jgi:hypothetical protein